MTDCPQFEQWGLSYIYADLAGEAKKTYETHLAQCDRCRASCQSVRKTLAIMDKRSRDMPDAAFWTRFDENLAAAISEDEPHKNQKKRYLWLRQGLIAAAILALGMFLGKAWFTPQTSQLPDAQLAVTHSEKALFNQADEYVQRSKMLLIGLVNMEIDPATKDPLDFAIQRRLSRDLMTKAAYLRQHYPDSGRARLLDLMDALEIIFLQIAHLEAQGSLEGLAVIREGVSRGDLLLKINLEQLRPSLANRSPTGDRLL